MTKEIHELRAFRNFLGQEENSAGNCAKSKSRLKSSFFSSPLVRSWSLTMSVKLFFLFASCDETWTWWSASASLTVVFHVSSIDVTTIFNNILKYHTPFAKSPWFFSMMMKIEKNISSRPRNKVAYEKKDRWLVPLRRQLWLHVGAAGRLIEVHIVWVCSYVKLELQVTMSFLWHYLYYKFI